MYRIELGAGFSGQWRHPDWHHQDIDEATGCDVICDLKELHTVLGEDIIDEAQMDQVLEHFGRYEVDELLSSISKAIKIGGCFRGSVPHMGKGGWPSGLVGGATNEECFIERVYGAQVNPHYFHKWGYSPTSLKVLLSKYFSKVEILIPQWSDIEFVCYKGEWVLEIIA